MTPAKRILIWVYRTVSPATPARCEDGVFCATIRLCDVEPYIDRDGRVPFDRWFENLDATTRARVTVFLERLGHGNTSNIKSVGSGVFELRVDFGPSFRVYFGRDGDTLVILLGGGTKKRQQADIMIAQSLWQEYKTRKREP